jgi:hypothetical protein
MKTFPLIVGSLLIAGIATGATVVVDPNNPNGWAFETTDADGNNAPANGNTAQFVVGPAVPPGGTGSAQLATAMNQGDTSSQIRNTLYDGVRVADLTSLSYWTYVTNNAPNNQQFPYIELNIATSGSGPADDILFFEPPYQTHSTGNPSLPDQGPTMLNTWQQWDALNGGWWDNNGVLNPGTGVGSLQTFLQTYPDATIENTASGLGGVRLTMGFASPGDNFNGYVDNFQINGTTYDFEPVPEPATWLAGGIAAAALALGAVRRLSRNRVQALKTAAA